MNVSLVRSGTDQSSMSLWFQQIEKKVAVFNMLDLIQEVTLALTILAGFIVLLYSLFDRRRIRVWSLWCSVLCGFIHVCYATATVFDAKYHTVKMELDSLKCSDIYTIPLMCVIITITILVTSAIDTHFRSVKASILKHIFFVYLMICLALVVAAQSFRKYQKPPVYVLTTSLSIRPTGCSSYPTDDSTMIALEYVLIYIPLAVAIIVVYTRSRKTQEHQNQIQFFTPCDNSSGCNTCKFQNSACQTVLIAFCVCMYFVRPLLLLLCSTFIVLNQDITPSMFSTTMYVYLCFEYGIILQNSCKQSQSTQTSDDIKHNSDVILILEQDTEASC